MIDNPKVKWYVGLVLGLIFAALMGLENFHYAGKAPWWLDYGQWLVGQVGILLGLNIAISTAPTVPKPPAEPTK